MIKTECQEDKMHGSNKELLMFNISCRGKNIKQTYQIKYLGFFIPSDPRCDTEINKRINRNILRLLSKMNPTLKPRNILMYMHMGTHPLYGQSYYMSVSAGNLKQHDKEIGSYKKKVIFRS